MDDSTLLDRLRDDDEIADLLDTVADVSIDRLDPVEDLYFASGTAFEVIAGDAGGGSFLLVGDPDRAQRSVVYTSSSGSAAWLGDSLHAALDVLIALPTIWHDVGGGRHSLEDLLRELEEDFPDLATDRDRLRDALDLPATASEHARERLLALAAQTRSAEMPRARFDDEPDSEYEPYWTA